VCATTHGAILFAMLTALPPTRWPTASEEPRAATSAAIAAIRNSEQKIRRHGDAVNVRWAFLIIDLGMELVDRLRNECRSDAFNQKPSGMSTFSGSFILAGRRRVEFTLDLLCFTGSRES
jgi:hypothetical protein